MDRRVILFLCTAALSGCEGLRAIHQPFMNSATPPRDAVVDQAAVVQGASARWSLFRAGQVVDVRLPDSVISGEVQSVEAYDSAAGVRCQRLRLTTGSGLQQWLSCNAGDQAEWSRDLTVWGRGS